MPLKMAQEPMQEWYQIPPSIRKKLTTRTQSKSQDVDGNIAVGMCLECSIKTEPGVGYCCEEHKEMNKAFTTCRCGSTNLEESRVTFPQNWPIEHQRGKISITKTCMACRNIVYVKTPDMPAGITPRGNKRTAAPDHVPLAFGLVHVQEKGSLLVEAARVQIEILENLSRLSLSHPGA